MLAVLQARAATFIQVTMHLDALGRASCGAFVARNVLSIFKTRYNVLSSANRTRFNVPLLDGQKVINSANCSNLVHIKHMSVRANQPPSTSDPLPAIST